VDHPYWIDSSMRCGENMKSKLFLILIGLVVVMAFIIPGVSATGNDAMSGQHFNLNLIGVKDINKYPGPAADDTNGGARIFIPLQGHSEIKLQQGDTFDVMDYVANTDGAKFMLPAPNNQYDTLDLNWYKGPGDYKVFVRVVGKPGGHLDQMMTCGTDTISNEQYCSTDRIINLGKSSKFTDVTKALTTVCGEFDDDPREDCVDIFDDAFYDYFWWIDNDGAKNVQLRFYPI
jgi:hypothetical protein